MEQKTIVAANYSQTSFSLLDTQSHLEKHYNTQVEGCGFIYVDRSNCEYPERYCLNHTVVVYLQSEQRTARQIDNTVQLEDINPGDIAIIPAQVSYWKKTRSEASPVIILTIAPDILSRLANNKINAYRVKLLPTFARPDLLIQSIALNLRKELNSDDCDRSYVESLYSTLMMHLLNHYSQKEYYSQQKNRGLPPCKLKQALHYINDNIDRSLKISEIAKLLGISQYYFCRLFRESTGIAPYRYVIQQRVSKAKKLIEQDRISLLDIAFECGFSSQSQMTYHFRKLVGTTPKVYRDRKLHHVSLDSQPK